MPKKTKLCCKTWVLLILPGTPIGISLGIPSVILMEILPVIFYEFLLGFLLRFIQKFLLRYLRKFLLQRFLQKFLLGFLQELFTNLLLGFLQEFLLGLLQEFLLGFLKKYLGFPPDVPPAIPLRFLHEWVHTSADLPLIALRYIWSLFWMMMLADAYQMFFFSKIVVFFEKFEVRCYFP